MPGVYVFPALPEDTGLCIYCQEQPVTLVVMLDQADAPRYPACKKCATARLKEATDAGYRDYLDGLEQRKTAHISGECPVCGGEYDMWVDPADDSLICPICGCDI